MSSESEDTLISVYQSQSSDSETESGENSREINNSSDDIEAYNLFDHCLSFDRNPNSGINMNALPGPDTYSSRHLNAALVRLAFSSTGVDSYKFISTCGFFEGEPTILGHYLMYMASLGIGYTKNAARPLEFGRRIYIYNVATSDSVEGLGNEEAVLTYRAGLIAFLCHEINNPTNLPVLTEGQVTTALTAALGLKNTFLPVNIDEKIADEAITVELLHNGITAILNLPLAGSPTRQLKSSIPENLPLTWIAMSKRGTITEGKLARILADLEQAGHQLDIPRNMISLVFADLKSFITPDKAELIFGVWNHLAGGVSLRLRITLDQVAGSGLTCLAIVRKAMTTFPHFPWGRVNLILPAEYTGLITAFTLVDNNAYYAWGEMGAASSRHYQTYTWVAAEVLREYGGPDYATIMACQSITNNPKQAVLLRALIAAFVPTVVPDGDGDNAHLQDLANGSANIV